MWKKPLILLLIIITLACFFRLWQLDLIPPGLYPDEAMNGNDALDALKNKNFKVFYPENYGREGIFIWLTAFSFAVFGPGIWALKIVSAFFGILTVLGIYLLTKELFSQYWRDGPSNALNAKIIAKRVKSKLIPSAQCVALFSSFFLAVSFWHNNFSRISFRAILVPFFLIFGFYFLLRGFRKWKACPAPKQNFWCGVYDFIISGIFWGLGFYTYISFRVSVLLLFLFVIFKFIEYFKNININKNYNEKEKKQSLNTLNRTGIKYDWKWLINKMYLKDSWWKIDLFFLIVFLTALPIGIYFLQNPADFTGRAGGVSVFNVENPVSELGKSVIFHLGMFNFYGDGNWRHNFSGSPQLLWPIGVFFLIGLIIFVKDSFTNIKNKGFIFHVPGFIIFWFLIMLLPGFLSSEGIPHALRVIGAIPPVYIFSGFGAYWFFNKISRFYKTKKQIAVFYFISSIFLFSIAFSQYDKYFIQWGQKQNVKNAFSQDYVKIGNYLNFLSEDINKYVIVNQGGVPVPYPNGIPISAQTTIFIERTGYSKPRANYILPEDLEKVKIKKQTVIIPLNYDETLLKKMVALFPDGVLTKNSDGIRIYEIKP